MDNAVWTPTEAGTQAQGMDLVQEKVDEDLVEPEPGPLRDPSILKLSLKMDTDPSPLENWIELVIAEPAFSLCQLCCLKREIYDPLITIKERSEI